MSAHVNFVFGVDRKLLKSSLDVARYAVGIVTSPGNVMILPTTVIQVRCVSYF